MNDTSRREPASRGPVTIKDVAEHLGVAASSVSRVLNDHPDVSADMRERVKTAAAALGYQPDYLAQSLRRGDTRTVGFVLRDLSNPIFADIVKGAETRLREAGYSLILTNSEADPDRDVKNIQLLHQRRVDGLILALQSEVHEREVFNARNGNGVPIVLVDRDVPGLEASAVRCEHALGVRSAVAHLIELGHRRVAFISGSEDILATRERFHGYRSAFDQAGIAIDDDLVKTGSYAQEFGYEQTIRLMSRAERPTAIVAAGLQLTAGVLAALQKLHIAVGSDVSLVSCDEVELLRYVSPAISVVRRDAALMGKLVAELLLEGLRGDAPRDAVVPTEYVARGSSAPAPG